MPIITEVIDALEALGSQYQMEVGDSFHGSILDNADEDWVEIEFVAGQSYELNLRGTGTLSELRDPFLRLRDADGTVVAFNDDTAGFDSRILFTPITSGTYYIEADAYASNTGDYTITVAEVAPASATAALEWGDGEFAGGSGQVISVYFATAGTTVADGDSISGGATVTSDGFTAAEIATIMEIYGEISNFADITFERTMTQNGADMQLAHDDLGAGFLGFMYAQNTSGNVSDGVGVLTSNPTYWNDTTMQRGGGMYGVLAHEIGHGLGLAHPHDTGGGSEILPGVGNVNLNQTPFTVMSYNEGWDGHPLGNPTETDGSGHLAGYAALDISVLQSYYGVNTTYANGNNTYTLGVDAYYAAIWDTGGTDTITTSGTGNATIDLRAATLLLQDGGGGFVSCVDNVMGGFTIANGAVIENASGASGNDVLQGNSVGNRLLGKGGNDTIFGGGNIDSLFGGTGNDVLNGGSGNDYLRDDSGADTFNGGSGFDIVAYSGKISGTNANLLTGANNSGDTYISIENLMGSKTANDNLTGNNGSNTIWGRGGEDRVYGLSGDDELYGGAGKDSIYGGSNNDTLYGGYGNDYLRDDSGADSFIGGGGSDTASYYGSSTGITANLLTGANNSSDTYSSIENLMGSNTANDNLTGNNGANRISGWGGNDTLTGLDGKDFLVGGKGSDQLFGGDDEDTFHFNLDDGNDTVRDFQNNIDTIEFDNFTFAPGEDAFSFANQTGANVVFDFGGGDILTVQNATITQLLNDVVDVDIV